MTTTAAQAVSDDDVARFARDGFLVLPRFLSSTLLEELRTAYDEILDRRAAARGDRMLGGITRQVMVPSADHPAFASNDAVDAGIAVAQRLLGETDVQRSFDMLIDKPAGHPHPTPWHQDMAYADHPFAAAGSEIVLRSVQFWVALDDADEENGCMHFAPGHHLRPLLEHRVVSGDPADDSRLLALADESDLAGSEVTCAAVPAGGATVHSYGTPHFTPPNRSAHRSRRAYIFNIATAEAARRIVSNDPVT